MKLIKAWKSLAVAALLGGLAGFLLSSFIIAPEYTASSALYIAAGSAAAESEADTPSAVYPTDNLTNTCVEILQTDYIINEVRNKLDGDALRNHSKKETVQISAINQSDVIRISVTTGSPELSYSICEVYTETARSALEEIVSSCSVTILSYPGMPTEKSAPDVPLWTALSALLFLSCMVIIRLIRIAGDNTVDRDFVSACYRIPLLGSVPDFFRYAKALGISKKNVSQSQNNRKKKARNERIITQATVLGKNTPFPISTAYTTIRTILSLVTPEREQGGVFVFVGPSANDLTTTTAVNLSISAAQMGSKVLLVDADLRDPSVYRYFGTENKNGLSRVLMGFDRFEDAVIRDVRPGVDFISAGPFIPSPAELLGSERMINFIADQSGKYDYIFIDTAPVNVVPDALLLAAMSDGIILTVRENKTDYREIDEAVRNIRMVDAEIIGMILTDASCKDEYYGKPGFRHSGTPERKPSDAEKPVRKKAEEEGEDYQDDSLDFDWDSALRSLSNDHRESVDATDSGDGSADHQ